MKVLDTRAGPCEGLRAPINNHALELETAKADSVVVTGAVVVGVYDALCPKEE